MAEFPVRIVFVTAMGCDKVPVMEATIISIGAELVSGRCVDTNAAWLSNQLTAVGVEVGRHVTVGDEVETIALVIRAGLDRGGLLIVTGGLGPTPDDRTREGLARAVGRPLVEDPHALAQIEAFFARIDRPMRDSNRVQALLPEGCAALDNPRGTAPGIHFDTPSTQLFALPGVPDEMKAMYQRHVLPVATKLAGGSRSAFADLACFGISEARIGETLADLMAEGRNPQVGTSAADAIITVGVTARGAHEEEAQRLRDADVAEIKRRLAAACLGEATLQESVARLLIESGETVATAESCTGGMLGAKLTEVPGSSAYFIEGAVTYANAAKSKRLGVAMELIDREGAVSEAVCRAMATGCRDSSGSNYALSITGIAGPGGGSAEKPVGLVYVGLAQEAGTEVKKVLFGAHLSRDEIRDRACKVALNMLRLELLSQP